MSVDRTDDPVSLTGRVVVERADLLRSIGLILLLLLAAGPTETRPVEFDR